MTITLRAVKGSALTHGELDGNFSDLLLRIGQDSSKLTANAMPAAVIDTGFVLNTKSTAAALTLTYSAQPAAANTSGVLRLVNTGGVDLTHTFPSSYSVRQNAVITSISHPAGQVLFIWWEWDGTRYVIQGEAVREVVQIPWSMVGTSAARDYPPMILKNQKPLVILGCVSKCVSGAATLTLKIDGVALGGGTNAVSSAEVDQPYTSANVVALNTDLVPAFTAGAVDPALNVYGYLL